MRLIKMLGLAMVAAVAAMALIGASSASAVVLCKTAAMGETCGAGESYANGTVVKNQLEAGTVAKLETTNLGTVECKKSSTEGKTTGSTAETLEGEITSVKFEECTRNGAACKVTTENTPYIFLVHLALLTAPNWWERFHLTIHPKPAETGPKPQAHVECGLFINCKFGAKLILFGLVNASALPVKGKVEQEMEREGGVCPEKATWKATYEQTAPTPAYVAMNP